MHVRTATYVLDPSEFQHPASTILKRTLGYLETLIGKKIADASWQLRSALADVPVLWNAI